MDLYITEATDTTFHKWRVRDRDKDSTLVSLFSTQKEANEYIADKVVATVAKAVPDIYKEGKNG